MACRFGGSMQIQHTFTEKELNNYPNTTGSTTTFWHDPDTKLIPMFGPWDELKRPVWVGGDGNLHGGDKTILWEDDPVAVRNVSFLFCPKIFYFSFFDL